MAVFPEHAAAWRARWIWTGPGDCREGAWVSLADGHIAAVEPRPAPACRARDLGEGVLLPGLVNAHAHLELSHLAGRVPPGKDFVAWLNRLVAARPEGNPAAAAGIAVTTLAGSGVALVGDIANSDRSLAPLSASPLSAVVFTEALGPCRCDPPAEELTRQAGRWLGRALAAHAPYSVPAARLRALKRRARRLPFCLHLAESRAEVEFFAGRGAEGDRLAEFLAARGVTRQDLDLAAPTPLGHVLALGLLDANTLAVHGAQFTEREAADFARSGASLCLCPRSNLALGGRLAPARRLLDLGVNLALGTDSLASAPDLSLWAEMATLARQVPALGPEDILTMATLGGARALGLGDHLGRLAPGLAGRPVFLPLAAGRPGEALAKAVHGEWLAPPIPLHPGG